MEKAAQNAALNPSRRGRPHKHAEVSKPSGDLGSISQKAKCSVTHSMAKLDAKTKHTAGG